MRSMKLASCKDDAASVWITWDDTVAYDRWRVSTYTVENRLEKPIPFELRVDGQAPMSGEIPANYTPPVESVVPNNYKVHPQSVNVWFLC